MRALSMSRCIGASLALLLLSQGGPSNAAGAARPIQPAPICRDIQEDMTSGQECLLPSGTLQSVYRDIVSRRLVRDSHCLLRELPSASTRVKGCKNNSGLLGVEYGISDGAVEIDMAYAGGISTIELERKADGVRRKITLSAD